jgi:hypothetical protein
MRLAVALLVVLLLPSLASAQTAGTQRVALVIGNSAYSDAPLRNPANDARAISSALGALGFRVTSVIDADHKAMQKAIIGFTSRLDENTTALFYYAGHGVQSRGRNYLLPVDAKLDSEAALRFEAIDVGALVEEMGLSRSRVSFVILDACRNNPFERRFRGASRGLAAIDAARGTLIAYATAPGSVAADGEGKNGLYTSEFLKALDEPGLKAEDVFKRVRIAVSDHSKGRQVPWESSSLTGDFVFNQSEPVAQPATSSPTRPHTADGSRVEAAFWETVRDSGSPAAYEEYLRRFPQGTFTGLARIRLAELGGGKAQGSAESCPDFSGTWRSNVPGSPCPTSRMFLKRAADGTYGMTQEGCIINATGTARVNGKRMVLDWNVPLCNGRTEIEFDRTCVAGKGEVVIPANFLLCTGRYQTTLERLPAEAAK